MVVVSIQMFILISFIQPLSYLHPRSHRFLQKIRSCLEFQACDHIPVDALHFKIIPQIELKNR